VLSHANN
ncbi:hypothetical protein CP8484711_1270B, partial [Chlamydia psittaci 84-8471/1]